jgi:hypothetical protein
MRRWFLGLLRVGVWLLGLGVFSLEVYSWWATGQVGLLPPLPRVGNFPAQLRSLPDRSEAGSYRFAVLGDPEGTRAGLDVLAALQEENPDFLMLTGDVMHGGRMAYHQLAVEWLHKLGPLKFPIFWLVGNRDIRQESFTMEDFEARYGPTNVWFSHGQDLFILLRLADPSWDPKPAQDFLLDVLREQRSRHRRVFVFSHVAPALAPELDPFKGGRGLLPETTKWITDVCKKNRVDYFLSAHFHGYSRTEKDGTVYLVSGGGGGSLHSPQDRTGFHGLLLTVGPQGVEERLVKVPPHQDLAWRVREASVGEVYPFLRRKPLEAGLVNLVLLGLMALFRPRSRPSS